MAKENVGTSGQSLVPTRQVTRHTIADRRKPQRWCSTATKVASLSQSALRQALLHMGVMWHGLQVFLDDPNVELDNNRIERILRCVVLGRKNHLGSRSERGTEVAALFHSFVESARLNAVDPAHYLRCAVDAGFEGAPPVLPRHAMLLT